MIVIHHNLCGFFICDYDENDNHIFKCYHVFLDPTNQDEMAETHSGIQIKGEDRQELELKMSSAQAAEQVFKMNISHDPFRCFHTQ
jgi:hypothetical protein